MARLTTNRTKGGLTRIPRTTCKTKNVERRRDGLLNGHQQNTSAITNTRKVFIHGRTNREHITKRLEGRTDGIISNFNRQVTQVNGNSWMISRRNRDRGVLKHKITGQKLLPVGQAKYSKTSKATTEELQGRDPSFVQGTD